MNGLLSRLSSLTADDNEKNDLLARVVAGLMGQQVRLSDVMQSLGHLAVSKSSNDRHTCLSILLHILKEVPESGISQEEADILTTFSCQRLSHENDMIPILLDMIYQLSQRTVISDTSTMLMYNTLSKEISVPQQRIEDRFIVYQIIQHLGEKNFPALTSDTFDFLINLFTLMEGERDPRCLILKFRLFAQIIPKLELSHLFEEAFECIAVYFPISYNAPTNDPYAIRREDLANSLIPCFRSCTDFAGLFYQLIGDKVTSERHQSKVDCYTGIAECAQYYGPDPLKPYMSIFWTCIRSDCIKVDNSDDDLKSAACHALTAIVRTMSEDEENLMHLLTEIEQDLRPALVKQDLNLRHGAMRLLKAAAMSENSYIYFENNLIPHLMTSMAFNTSRINAIEVHDMLIEFYSEEFADWVSSIRMKHNPVILSLCLTEEKEHELISRKLMLLHNVITLRLELSEEGNQSLEKYVNNFVLDQSCSLHHMDSSILGKMIEQGRIQIGEEMISMLATGDPARLTALYYEVTIPQPLMKTFLEAAVTRALGNSDEKMRDFFSLIVDKVKSDCQMLLVTNAIQFLILSEHLELVDILVQRLDSKHSSMFMRDLHSVPNDPIEFPAFMQAMSSVRFPVSLAVWEVDDLIGRWCLSQDESLVNPLICCLAAKSTDDSIRDMLIQFVREKKQLSSAGYVSKGLAWAGKGSFTQTLDLVLESFKTEDSDAAAHIILRMHEEEDCLKNFPRCNFYHQRVFFSTLPSLTALLQSSISDQQKEDVKKAFLGQLKFLPKNVIKSDLRKIHSLIINSLSFTASSSSRSSGGQATDGHSVALDCLKHLLDGDSSVTSLVSNNLNSILKSLSRLSTLGNLTDRRNSLICLTMIARTIPELSLIPHRKFVLKSLSECLRDRKRVVRYAAADATLRWVLVGQPGNQVDEEV